MGLQGKGISIPSGDKSIFPKAWTTKDSGIATETITSKSVVVKATTGDFTGPITYLSPFSEDEKALDATTTSGIEYDPSGMFLTVTTNYDPYIRTYYIDEDNGGTCHLQNYNYGTPAMGKTFGLSHDIGGNCFVFGSNVRPYLNIVRRQYAVYGTSAAIDIQPPVAALYPTIDPTGKYVATALNSTPYIMIYKDEGAQFVKLPNPDVMPATNCQSMKFDPTGTYLAAALVASPFLMMYRRDGDTFTKISTPVDVTPKNSRFIAFDPTGTYMAVTHTATPFLTMYKRYGDMFVNLNHAFPDIVTAPGLPVWDNIGRTFIVPMNGTIGFIAYECNGDTFTRLNNFGTHGVTSGLCATFSPNGKYMAMLHSGANKVMVCTANMSDVVMPFKPVSNKSLCWAPNGKLAISKNSGNKGDQIQVELLDALNIPIDYRDRGW